MSRSVAIIGGGYAGMACAVELARTGHEVTVFERSLILGGRARLVTRDDWQVDNGQHIVIGAYTELARLLRLIGVSAKAFERIPLTLHVPGRLHLRAAHLPAPLHLAVGLLRAKGLDWDDRKAMLRLTRHLKKSGFKVEPGSTVRSLLHVTGQTPRLTTLIWNPLCIAALNTLPAEASAQVFADVLRDSLCADANASELLIPRVDLTELFPVQAARYLALKRCKINTGNGIEGLTSSPAGFRLVGDPIANRSYEHVVIATAPYHAASLLDSAGGCERLARQIDALPYEPITTVYFALGPNVRLPYPMIGLADGPAQWAFDRGQLGSKAGLIALVISAHGPHEALSR
ncbi:MAG: FAD-dependent oxidoreductase, partial [Zoogloeaceae bacterium]|nr:FAD-dependent oxidoreductase [Zoogloeaceae bacterium]